MVPWNKKVKIRQKTIDCIFIGYAHNNNAYHFFVHESKVPDVYKNTIMELRNASFFKHVFPCNSRVNLRELQQFHETTIEDSQNEGNYEAQKEVQEEEQ